MLHFRAIEMCLFLVLFSFGFPAHEIPQSKVKKKGGNSKYNSFSIHI